MRHTIDYTQAYREDARRRDDWWYSRATPIYDGAREIQHSIIADRILSMPKESAQPGEELVYENISVRNVTYLPIAFEPRADASA